VYLPTCRLLGAKRLYYLSKLEENAGNSKITWDTLNKILGKSRSPEIIEKINANGVPTSDPVEIANQFNSFFTAIGREISENVQPIEKKAEEYINYGRNVPDLLLQNTTPEHIKKIIKNLKPKQSQDAQGI
jgi:hypothetical protein